MFIKCILLLFVLSFVESEFSDYNSSAASCPIPRIKNGGARPRQRGKFVRFSCNAQYTLVGNKYAVCRFGQWDVPIPVCVKKGCQQLEEVKNAVNMTSHNDAWVVFFCLPGHQLVGSPVIYCDGSQWNSTAPGCYESSATKPETECDFEQPNICGWKPDEYHDFDWRRLNKKTPSSFLQTGPQYDHTYGKNGSGYYMYIESTSRIVNETARLMSPVYEADLAKDGCFVFWYHMFGSLQFDRCIVAVRDRTEVCAEGCALTFFWNKMVTYTCAKVRNCYVQSCHDTSVELSMGGLVVYQKPAKLSTIQLQGLLLQNNVQNYTLFKQWGDQGNEWHNAIAILSDFGDNFQIVIEGIRGESFMSDLAIDDVSIQHGENCTKAMVQATTPPSLLRPTTEEYSSSDTSGTPTQTEELVTTTSELFTPTPSSTTTAITMSTTKRPIIPISHEPTTTTTTTEKPETTTTATEKPASSAIGKPATTTSSTEKLATTISSNEKPETTTTATEKPASSATGKPATTTSSTEKPETTTTATEKPASSATGKPATTTSSTEKLATTTSSNEKPETTTTATEKPASSATGKPATTTSSTEKPATTTEMPATNKSPSTSPSTSITNTTTTPKPTSPRKTIPTTSRSKIVTIDVSLLSSSTISVVRTTMDNVGVKIADFCTCDCRANGKG